MTANYAGPGWTPTQDAKLRALWKRGDLTALIAIAIGKSKNSVIGRAHRLGLAARKNPISGRTSKPRVERLPAFKPRMVAQRVPFEEPTPAPAPVREPEPVEAPAPPPPAEEVAPLIQQGEPDVEPYRPFMLPAGRCQWIAGPPSPDDHCKCGRRAIPGRPYCPDHEAKAYSRRQMDAPSAA